MHFKKVSLFLFSLVLAACHTVEPNERLSILSDFGIYEETPLTQEKLTEAMHLMLPYEGSVEALEVKFRYIFYDDMHKIQPLDKAFKRLYEIESDGGLQMQEVKRLLKENPNHNLLEFWLDKLAQNGNPEAHYILHDIAGWPDDIEPIHLIFAAENGFLDAEVKLGDWYYRRNAKGDRDKALIWYLKAQRNGFDMGEKIRKMKGE